MDITEDLVRHVAHLARLELTDTEVAEMAPQLGRIFKHVEGVQQIDAGDADPATQAAIAYESLRADEPGETLSRRAITTNAPEHDGSFLVVPHVMESGEPA